MLRDPRAIYVSDRYRRQNKKRWPYHWLDKVPLLLESYLVVLTIVSWRSAVRLHPQLKERHPNNYRLVRFEDVVTDPDHVLPEVFGFLGVEVPAGRKVGRPGGYVTGCAARMKASIRGRHHGGVSASIHSPSASSSWPWGAPCVATATTHRRDSRSQGEQQGVNARRGQSRWPPSARSWRSLR